MIPESQHDKTKGNTALVLPGGGARNAYQVGVLKGLSSRLSQIKQPFPILCGSSAGALNTALLAAYAEDFHQAVRTLSDIWENLHTHDVYRADQISTLRAAAAWAWQLSRGRKDAHYALLDNQPLKALLQRSIPEGSIQKSLHDGHLKAIGINASSYSDGDAVTFFQSHAPIEPWVRSGRRGVPVNIGVEHFLASAAIPVVFPAQKVEDAYYGDGSLRQVAPLSGPLNLGANRMVVISIGNLQPSSGAHQPCLGTIGAHLIESMFNERLESDLEHLEIINHLLTHTQTGGVTVDHKGKQLQPAKVIVIRPSIDLSETVDQYIDRFPRDMRLALRFLGAFHGENPDILSFLLFDGKYAKKLIDIGYEDGCKHAQAVCELIGE